MIIDIQNYEIKGAKLFYLKTYKDNRGSFAEVFRSVIDYPEFKLNYIQENESVSNYGVFRGMHFQKGIYSQSKLVRVVKGKVIDVICDLRKSSPSFKKCLYINLDPNKILFIPKGIAHGFLSLESETILNYKCDNLYRPNFESGFNLFKSNINLKFPLSNHKIIESVKDKLLPDLDNSYIYKSL